MYCKKWNISFVLGFWSSKTTTELCEKDNTVEVSILAKVGVGVWGHPPTTAFASTGWVALSKMNSLLVFLFHNYLTVPTVQQNYCLWCILRGKGLVWLLVVRKSGTLQGA
jgi:hypothetical protein